MLVEGRDREGKRKREREGGDRKKREKKLTVASQNMRRRDVIRR